MFLHLGTFPAGIHRSLPEKIEFEPTNCSGFDPRSSLIFEGKSVGGTLNHASATPDAAVAMSDLYLAYILAFFKTRLGTDLPAKVDALATFGIERDVPARLLEMAPTLYRR